MEINDAAISDLTLKHTRDINLLLDDKRPAVIGSLNNLTKLIESKEVSLQAKIFFFENRVLRNFLVVLENNSDSVRESAIKMLEKLNDQLDPSVKDCSLKHETQDAILLKLISRVNSIPFRETIEEIRLSICRLFLKLLRNFNQGLYKNLSDVIQVCSCLLQDKYPENKKETCALIIALATQMPELVGMSCRRMLVPLMANCSHSHSKVRKVSMECIGQLLILPKAGECFKDVFDGIKGLLDDKNSEIREEAYKSLGLCLQNFGFADIKQYEIGIIAEILSALDDDNERIRSLGSHILESFATRRKGLFEKYNS